MGKTIIYWLMIDRCDFNGNKNIMCKNYVTIFRVKEKKQAACVTRDIKITPSFPDFQQCE